MAPTEAVLREIARGGLAGLVAGVLVAGVGGRIVMRLAALLVPAADGAITENGNVVGTITFGGSLALVLFIGLFFGIVAGSLWVVIQSWLPATALRRTVAAVPVAVALGTVGLVDARNPDFGVLGHSPPVVASLVVLVALFAPVLVLAERWLDGRLPRPGPTDRAVVAGYTIVTMIGSPPDGLRGAAPVPRPAAHARRDRPRGGRPRDPDLVVAPDRAQAAGGPTADDRCAGRPRPGHGRGAGDQRRGGRGRPRRRLSPGAAAGAGYHGPMTDQPVSVPDLRAGLIDTLRAARAVERAILDALDPAERDTPAADGGWSPKDIQAHLSAWRRHQADRMATQRTRVADEDIPPTETDAANAVIHAERAHWSWEQVLADTTAATELLITEVEVADDATLSEDRTIGSILGNGPEHDLTHLPPIAARVGLDLSDQLVDLATSVEATVARGGWPSRSAAFARYNLACYHALGGRLEEARGLLRLALPANEELRGCADRRRPGRAPRGTRRAVRRLTGAAQTGPRRTRGGAPRSRGGRAWW